MRLNILWDNLVIVEAESSVEERVGVVVATNSYIKFHSLQQIQNPLAILIKICLHVLYVEIDIIVILRLLGIVMESFDALHLFFHIDFLLIF